jgi:hypothetical protein
MMKKIAAVSVLFSLTSIAPALAADFNGNLCETDIQYHCLGLQGLGRAEVVKCLRRHMSDLSSDCRKVMSDRNFKPRTDETPAPSDQSEQDNQG